MIMPGRDRPFLLRLGPLALAADLAAVARVTGAGLGLALRCLPGPAAVLLAVILASALGPTVLVVLQVVGALQGAPALAYVAGHPALAWALAAGVAGGALLIFEVPRSWSLSAYGRQLRARAQLVRSQYLAALRSTDPQSYEE